MYIFNHHRMNNHGVKRNVDKLFPDFSTLFCAQSGRQPFHQKARKSSQWWHMYAFPHFSHVKQRILSEIYNQFKLILCKLYLIKEACKQDLWKQDSAGFLALLWQTVLNASRLAYLKYLMMERKYKINYLGEKKKLSDIIYLKLFWKIVT